MLAVTLVQYIKCPINHSSSSLLWCKYRIIRIIRQLIKHRLQSLYTVFGTASAEPFCGLCWRIYCKHKYHKETYFTTTDRLVSSVSSHRSFFWSGHKIPLCHENRIQLYHDNQKSVKNMFYDTGLALMLGLNHLKAERKNVVKH